MCECFHIRPYVNYSGRTVLCVHIAYCIYDNMYDVSTQGTDERMINVHYYYYPFLVSASLHTQQVVIILCFANYKLSFEPLTGCELSHSVCVCVRACVRACVCESQCVCVCV